MPREVGLLGFGLAGSVFHAPLIEATPGLRLAAVVTSNEERAAAVRRTYPAAEVLGRADDMWGRADELDLVVVATSNESHVPLARTALEMGIGTVVDKPLAPTAAEARGLVELAMERGALLTVFHNRRRDSDFLTARRLIDTGRLGRVHRFESRFERWEPELPAGAWRTEVPRERGGGVLLDLGTHLIDQALQLFGDAEEVTGRAHRLRGGPADDDAFVTIRHRNGVESHLYASQLAAEPGPRLRLLGDRGTFVLAEPDGQEAALKAGRRPGGEGEDRWGAEPRESWGRLYTGSAAEDVPSARGIWPSFYRELRDAVATGGPPPVDPADAVAVLEIIERVPEVGPPAPAWLRAG
jgi:scyllo-inositol 2-dehydrogenase (NADP+)